HTVDIRPHAGYGGNQFAHQLEERLVMALRLVAEIHHLDGEIDALAGGIGVAGTQDVLLAQDRLRTLAVEPGALIVVGAHRLTQDEPFARLEFDLQWHRRMTLSLSSNRNSPVRSAMRARGILRIT